MFLLLTETADEQATLAMCSFLFRSEQYKRRTENKTPG